jgi:hypothetical protein
MANNRKFQDSVSKAIEADSLYREGKVQKLMSEGISWSDAYWQVNFPNMTKEAWVKMCADYDTIFGIKK